MTTKDQQALAKLYMENSDMSSFETEAPHRNDDEHAYQDTWHEDLRNSDEYKALAIIVHALRNTDNRLASNSIMSIINGDRNILMDALDELG